MRLINSLLMAVLLVVCGLFLWIYNDSVVETIDSWTRGKNDEIITLEARYSPLQILSLIKKKHVEDENLTSANPSLFFRPYLMMHVKFPGNDGKIQSGVLLWSLVDGEAVINGDTWEMTNGFSDTIANHASKEEFRLLEVLSHNGGSITKAELQKRLKMDDEHLEKLLTDAKADHLLLEKDGRYSLTFSNSKIDISPQTHFSEPLATKVYSHALREQASFDKHQIETIAVSAFGSSFTVEKTQEVYLPVYAIETPSKQEKGGVLTTYWNGLTGKQLSK
jgi:hypothetical protein